MKIRSLAFVGALAAMGTVFGTDVVTGNTCAAMAIPAAGDYTLIAVPFKGLGGTEQTVKVAELVKTMGLKAGSKLYYYDGTNYKTWNLAADGGSWEGVAVTCKIDGKDVTTVSPGADFALPCGSTLWLERAAGSTASVVVYGEEGTAISTPVTANAVQLISNPKAADHEVVEVGSDGDMLMIPDAAGKQTTYTYKTAKSGWCTFTTANKTVGDKTISTKVYTKTTVTIPGGRGAWYVSKGTTVPTFNW